MQMISMHCTLTTTLKKKQVINRTSDDNYELGASTGAPNSFFYKPQRISTHTRRYHPSGINLLFTDLAWYYSHRPRMLQRPLRERCKLIHSIPHNTKKSEPRSDFFHSLFPLSSGATLPHRVIQSEAKTCC